jgi:organic radical activating enzyme
MIQLEHAQVSWALNAHCGLGCSYCHSQYSGGALDKSIDQYLSVVEKLQNTRYQHHSRIYWKISGGEPLQFPHLGTLLKKMKEKPCTIRLDTSGDDNWFSFFGVSGLIDSVQLTYHSWQNDDVFDFILEQSKEKNINVTIEVPLRPGSISESRAKVKHFQDLGYACDEQILRDLSGDLHPGYSQLDQNRIYGRPDDWRPEPVVYDPNAPNPNYVDLSTVNNTDPVYTGKPCYAGVDWLHINPRGFASYSQCGGRNEHYNAFDPNWQPPRDPFPCTVNQCRSEKDRSRIRIIS